MFTAFAIFVQNNSGAQCIHGVCAIRAAFPRLLYLKTHRVVWQSTRTAGNF